MEVIFGFTRIILPAGLRDNFLLALREMIESGEFPNLWTDVSYTLFQSEAFLPFLRLFLKHPRVRARTLFGSDFYMTRQEDLSERAMAVRLRMGLALRLELELELMLTVMLKSEHS